jgi:hypothetical protein
VILCACKANLFGLLCVWRRVHILRQQGRRARRRRRIGRSTPALPRRAGGRSTTGPVLSPARRSSRVAPLQCRMPSRDERGGRAAANQRARVRGGGDPASSSSLPRRRAPNQSSACEDGGGGGPASSGGGLDAMKTGVGDSPRGPL